MAGIIAAQLPPSGRVSYLTALAARPDLAAAAVHAGRAVYESTDQALAAPQPIIADPNLVAFATESLGKSKADCERMAPYRFDQVAAVQRSAMRPDLAMATVGTCEGYDGRPLIDFVVPEGKENIQTWMDSLTSTVINPQCARAKAVTYVLYVVQKNPTGKNPPFVKWGAAGPRDEDLAIQRLCEHSSNAKGHGAALVLLWWHQRDEVHSERGGQKKAEHRLHVLFTFDTPQARSARCSAGFGDGRPLATPTETFIGKSEENANITVGPTATQAETAEVALKIIRTFIADLAEWKQRAASAYDIDAPEPATRLASGSKLTILMRSLDRC